MGVSETALAALPKGALEIVALAWRVRAFSPSTPAQGWSWGGCPRLIWCRAVGARGARRDTNHDLGWQRTCRNTRPLMTVK